LRKVFADTLVESQPQSAVTFVDNHDTQPLQSLESTVADWFQPHAYALILLREAGIPCVFYPAIYGATYTASNKKGKQVQVQLSALPMVEIMMTIRKEKSYGLQTDYFESRHLIGWTRRGEEDKAYSGCAVIMSTKKQGALTMSMGILHAGQTFYDATGNVGALVTLNEQGEGTFIVNTKSVSVWIVRSEQF
jgi:alpha-amylase